MFTNKITQRVDLQSTKLSTKNRNAPARKYFHMVFTYAVLIVGTSVSINTQAITQDTSPVLVVTSSRHAKDDVLINEFVSLDQVAVLPSSVAELLAFEQGLSINGQPGLFQTISIRGLARQRVHTYISGMRITSERSAGVAASFIDPFLLSGVEVTQGPASTYYGSGAIAGGIHLAMREEDSLWMQSGFSSDGNERAIAMGNGNQNYLASFAFRERDNGETQEGEEKNDQFSQAAINYLRHFNVAGFKLDWQFIATQGKFIGKDNSRYPDNRITSYPEENHQLSQLTISGDAQWVGRVYFHQQDLTTQEIRPAMQTNVVQTESLDIGASWENQWQLENFTGLYGIDYFARRDVSSVEVETDLDSQLSETTHPLAGAEEDELAIFATANREFAHWSLHSGVRSNYQAQNSETSEEVTDSFTTYFLTANKPLGDFNLSLGYGTGFRFASLSERLFSGTTGRGQTVGNANLLAEESRSLDFGVSYQTETFNMNAHRFKTRIDNFIERISIGNDTRSYQNITNGELLGWQYQLAWQPLVDWKIELAGQGVHGSNQLGEPLADIPAKRHQLALAYQAGEWNSRISYVHRMQKSAVGDGEIPLDAADILAFKVGYKINQHWRIQFSGNNLLDEAYFDSMDDLSTLAKGREYTLSISYL